MGHTVQCTQRTPLATHKQRAQSDGILFEPSDKGYWFKHSSCSITMLEMPGKACTAVSIHPSNVHLRGLWQAILSVRCSLLDVRSG